MSENVHLLASTKHQIIQHHNELLMGHGRAVTDVITTYVLDGKMYVVGSTQTRPVLEKS